MSQAPIVPNGVVDQSTSLSLFGQRTSFGQFLPALNQNLVQVLTNCADDSPPANPSEGQFWFAPTAGILSIWHGGAWIIAVDVGALALNPSDAANAAVAAALAPYQDQISASFQSVQYEVAQIFGSANAIIQTAADNAEAAQALINGVYEQTVQAQQIAQAAVNQAASIAETALANALSNGNSVVAGIANTAHTYANLANGYAVAAQGSAVAAQSANTSAYIAAGQAAFSQQQANQANAGAATYSLIAANAALSANTFANSALASSQAAGSFANTATQEAYAAQLSSGTANTAAANSQFYANSSAVSVTNAANSAAAASQNAGLSANAASNSSAFAANSRAFSNTAVAASQTASNAQVAALNSQGLAANSALVANAAAGQAANANTAAQIASTQAITANTTAWSAATTASTEASLAANSAFSAGGAANAAASSAGAANISAGYALSNATAAGSYATSAQASELQAAANAALASGSANTATVQATAAQVSAAVSNASANAASQNATVSASWAGNAATQATLALGYQTTTLQAANSATAANAAAQSASGLAVSAQTGAQTANTNAQTANTNAARSAANAATSEGQAAIQAQSAVTANTNAWGATTTAISYSATAVSAASGSANSATLANSAAQAAQANALSAQASFASAQANAVAALGSAQAAYANAVASQGSSSTAALQANAALAQAQASSNSANTALAQAQVASAQANAAANAAVQANTALQATIVYAGNASTYSVQASTANTNAWGAATAASTSSGTSATSAGNSQNASNNANAALVGANSANSGAQAAALAAAANAVAAQTFSGSASTFANSASVANTNAWGAATSATNTLGTVATANSAAWAAAANASTTLTQVSTANTNAWGAATAASQTYQNTVASTGTLTSKVSVLSNAVANAQSQLGQASFSVVANTGSSTAVFSLNAAPNGTTAALLAGSVFFGVNAEFDETTNTMQWKNGGYVRVQGAGFGAAGNLNDWTGAATTSVASMTTNNAVTAQTTGGAQYILGNAVSQWATLQTPATPAQTLSPNPNLCAGGDFSTGSTNWTKNGTNTLHTSQGGPNNAAWFAYITGNAIFYSDYHGVVPGLPYSFSGWVEAASMQAGNVRIIWQMLNSSGSVISSNNFAQCPAGSTWTEYTQANVVAPSGTTTLRIMLDTAASNGVQQAATYNGGGSSCGWCQVKVEQSTTVTPFNLSGSTTTGAVYSSGVTMDSLQPAQSNADVTAQNTAAALIGQGTLATMNSLALGSSQLTGFGSVASQSSLALGGSYLTGFGSVAGQSSLAYGGSYLTGFGSVATLNNGSSLTAGAITGQSALATNPAYSGLTSLPGSLSAIDSNGYLVAPWIRQSAGSGNFLGTYWPATVSADKTGNAQAASFAGQGQFATFTGYGTNILTQPVSNALYNSTFAVGGEGWTIGGYGTAPGVGYGKDTQGSYLVMYTAGGSAYYTAASTHAIPVSVNQPVYMQADLGMTDADTSSLVYIQLAFSDPNTPNTVYSFGGQIGTTAGPFTHVSGTNTAPSTAPSSGAGYWLAYPVCVYYKHSAASSTTCYAYFRNIMVTATQQYPWNDAATYGSAYSDLTSVNALRPAQIGANVTGTNQAASIAGQGSFATQSNLSLDNGSYFAMPNRLGNYVAPNGTSGLYAPNVMYTQGRTVAGSIDYYQPSTQFSDQTSGATAAGIAGQGPFATHTTYSYLTNVPGAGQNWAVNSDFKKGLYGWAISGSCGASVSQPAGSAYMYTALLSYNNSLASGSSVDPLSTAGAWNSGFAPNQYLLPIQTSQAGQTIFAGCLMGQHNCIGQMFILGFDGNGNLTEAPAWTGAKEYGNDNSVGNGDPAHYNFVGGVYTTTNANTRWVGLMVRMLGNGASSTGNAAQLWVSRMQLGTLLPGQTTVPPYSPGSADPYSDQTGTNQAASIAGQSYFATNTGYGGLSGLPGALGNIDGNGYIVAPWIRQSAGSGNYLGTYWPATTSADKTGNAQSASIAGQGPWATSGITIPGFMQNGVNYSSQNANSSATGTLDCAWITYGTYNGTNQGSGGGHTLASFQGAFDTTGRILQGWALPINTQAACSYVFSNSTSLSSAAGSGTINIASQTFYIVNQNYGLGSGSCTGLSTGVTYSIYYDFTQNSYTAVAPGNNAGYLTNPSRYGFLGSCYTAPTGTTPIGGGGNRGGVQP